MGPDEVRGELMTASGDRLLRLAYQLTHDRSLAEGVVQRTAHGGQCVTVAQQVLHRIGVS